MYEDPTVEGGFTGRMHYFVPHWLPGAPCATNQAPFPVVLYSPGHGGSETIPSDLAPNLASHGYVVVSVSPWEAGQTVLPDGTYMTQPDLSMTKAGALDRVRDLVFVLDELAHWNTIDAVFAGRLDLTKVAAIGGSWGGVTVAEFGRIENRCKAVIPLDPGGEAPPGLDQYGVQKPLLEITSRDINDTSLYTKAAKDAVWFQISGADHYNVAAADWYWFIHPEILAAGMESERTIIAYSLWFLDKYLKGESVPPAPLPGFPLVTGFMQK
jgi:dienelactone hydrolase